MKALSLFDAAWAFDPMGVFTGLASNKHMARMLALPDAQGPRKWRSRRRTRGSKKQGKQPPFHGRVPRKIGEVKR